MSELRRHIMMQQGGLPREYTEIPFVRGVVGQWLPTDIVAYADTSLVFDYEPDNPNTFWQVGAGSGVGTERFVTGRVNSIYICLGWEVNYYGLYPSGILHIELNSYSGKYILNGTTLYERPSSLISSVDGIAFFGRNAAGSVVRNHDAKLYRAKIYNSGVLTHDLVTVEDSNMTQGLYDIIRRRFYPLVNV